MTINLLSVFFRYGLWMPGSRHHCRRCGRVVCDCCSRGPREPQGSPTPKRVCDRCVERARAEDSEEEPPAVTSSTRALVT